VTGSAELTVRDLRGLQDVLTGLYELCDLSAFPDRAIAAVTGLIPAEVTSYNALRPADRHVVVTVNPPAALVLPGGVEIFAAHVAEHPLVNHYQRTHDGHAVRTSDLMTQRQFRATAIYQEFYRLVGVDQQLAFALPSPPSVVIGLAVNRLGRVFSDRERGTHRQADRPPARHQRAHRAEEPGTRLPPPRRHHPHRRRPLPLRAAGPRRPGLRTRYRAVTPRPVPAGDRRTGRAGEPPYVRHKDL
jgi:hypothetical protein